LAKLVQKNQACSGKGIKQRWLSNRRSGAMT
jgi:hypothetical protein